MHSEVCACANEVYFASSACEAAGPQHSRYPAVMYIARLVDSVAAFGPPPADLALQCTIRMVQEGP